jgi:hypothetical protein
MARLLVFVLLAGNLLYLGWTQWVRSEQPRLVSPAVAGSGTRPPALRPATVDAVPCTSIGPARDDTHALEIEQLLQDMQLSARRRSTTQQMHEGWWVYVATPDAAAQARTLRAMLAAGMRDAFAMADDPQFRISVGLFTEEAGARSRAEAVRSLRVEPVVSERIQQQTSVWFDLPGSVREAVDLARFEQEGVDVQALQVQDCPSGGGVDSATPEGPAAPEPATPPQV